MNGEDFAFGGVEAEVVFHSPMGQFSLPFAQVSVQAPKVWAECRRHELARGVLGNFSLINYFLHESNL